MKQVLTVFRDEFRRIFALRPVFSVLIVGSAFYAVFYPQPYLNEALRNVPIAIVDGDGTSVSRELARRIDATSDIAVTMVLPDLVSAEREVFARKIFGILVIPKNFERDLLHGRASPIALYADASYFLIYQRVSGAAAAVARTLGAEVETTRLIDIGVDPAVASSGRLRDLCPAGCLRPAPATDIAYGRRAARHPARACSGRAYDRWSAAGAFGDRCRKDAGLSAARGGHLAAVSDRAALFLRFAKARRRRPDSHLRRAVCPFHQWARPCRCGDLQEPAVGSTCPGGDRTAVFLPRRVCVANRGDPTRCPCGLIAGRESESSARSVDETDI